MSTPSVSSIPVQQRVEEWLQNGREAHGSRSDVITSDYNDRRNQVTDLTNRSPRNDAEQERRSKSMSRTRKLYEEAERLREEKGKLIAQDVTDSWREAIRAEIEENLERQVREALATPPLERLQRNKERAKQRYMQRLRQLNNHIHLDLTERERHFLRQSRGGSSGQQQAGDRARTRSFSEDDINMSSAGGLSPELSKKYEHLFNHHSADRATARDDHLLEPMEAFGTLSRRQKNDLYSMFTKRGLTDGLRRGVVQKVVERERSAETGRYSDKYGDKYGITRDMHGPFWPPDYGPLYAAPLHQRVRTNLIEPLLNGQENPLLRTHDTQTTLYTAKWRGVHTVYDAETSGRGYRAPPVPDGCAPSLTFESRFECANLRQARRVGQFEYELVLQTDRYTKRHTQWYYFRVENMLANITYKFIITNLLKSTSLYNHGMRPMIYSEFTANNGGAGWARTGHHISYGRNMTYLHSPLLGRDRSFYALEWQMEFGHTGDTCYLAHCYPYTFTDLRNDLHCLTSNPDRGQVIKQEVLCETRAGNSCFVLTVTNFGESSTNRPLSQKKCVVVSGRVHPGETNSSWMVKGLLDFITGADKKAKELRDRYVFKVVPMLNPDGVIVGNYRCSLSARDLNRNYRHPRKENFPTVWSVKSMVEEQCKNHEVVIYCDFHGHSRKSNVFMFGCDDAINNNNMTSSGTDVDSTNRLLAFMYGRLFPWLMAKRAPEKFCFSSCKFRVRRCKESTGRVVMWRQMNITNSFTLEAGFSGTTLQKDSPSRHFNTEDLADMGRVFCETVLEHQRVKQNPELQAATMIDITKALILRLVQTSHDPALQSPEFLQKLEEQLSRDDFFQTAEGTAMLVKLFGKDKQQQQQLGLEQSGNLTHQSRLVASASHTELGEARNSSVQTMESCLRLLEDLHVTEMIETDSSDSDSESEPEMKASHSPKKKKKKSKKKRNQEKLEKLAKKRNSLDARAAMCVRDDTANLADNDNQAKNSQALPSINSQENSDEKQKSNSLKSNSRARAFKIVPTFVSKFEGRHNNGIPCYSEERISERAAKKFTERQKLLEEQKQREAEIYFQTYQRLRSLDTPSLPVFNSQHAPLDYIHSYGHDTLCDSNPDSPLTESDSEEEEEEEESAPLARRPSLPAVGTASSHRFNLRHSGNRTSAAGSKSGTDTIYNLMRTISSKRRHSLGKPRKLKMAPSSDIREDYMKDIVVGYGDSCPYIASARELSAAIDRRNDVIHLLQSATINDVKSADLSKSENATFFKVNNRLGNDVAPNVAAEAGHEVVDSPRIYKKTKSKLLKIGWQVSEELAYQNRSSQLDHVNYCNLLKPLPPLRPFAAAPSVSAEVAVEKRSLVKQLRARAHLEPFKANDSRLPDS